VGFIRRNPRLRTFGRAAALLGLLADLGLVLDRNIVAWSCPVEDNFDTALLFAVMLGGVLFYLVMLYRQSAPAEGLPRRSVIDLVLLPLMILMQTAAAAICFGGFHHFQFTGAWRPAHLSAQLIATLLMAAAAVAAVLYLLLNRSLRRKTGDRLLGGAPSLERLEALMRHAVLWGFVLLTLSMIVGLMMLTQAGGKSGLQMGLAQKAKLLAAFAAWLVYAGAIATRFAPRFRGKWVAWLCILGFLLLLAAYAAAQMER
jgi:ABC-type uncharacterized transport system permease subunit